MIFLPATQAIPSSPSECGNFFFGAKSTEISELFLKSVVSQFSSNIFTVLSGKQVHLDVLMNSRNEHRAFWITAQI